MDRAKKAAAASTKISPKQLRKIDAQFLKDTVAAVQSPTFSAMSRDVKMFGETAFHSRSTQNKPPTPNANGEKTKPTN